MIVPAALARRNGLRRAFRSACSGEGGGTALSDALARRASSAALCRSSIARLLRSKRSDWASVGPLHLPHAHASCNRTSPLCRHKCDSRQYQAAATSHHRCRSGARGRCREAESPATSASPRPVLLFSNGKFALIGRQVGRQVGEQLGFASNKLGTTASSNATRRRAESCVSRYFGGCRFGFVGRGADEHSQGEVGGAGSHNGATRAAKPSDDGRSVRFRLGFCKYGLACAGTCVLVGSRRSGAGAHVLRGPLWRCGSSRKLPLRIGSSTRRSGAGDAFRGFVGV